MPPDRVLDVALQLGAYLTLFLGACLVLAVLIHSRGGRKP